MINTKCYKAYIHIYFIYIYAHIYIYVLSPMHLAIYYLGCNMTVSLAFILSSSIAYIPKNWQQFPVHSYICYPVRMWLQLESTIVRALLTPSVCIFLVWTIQHPISIQLYTPVCYHHHEVLVVFSLAMVHGEP